MFKSRKYLFAALPLMGLGALALMTPAANTQDYEVSPNDGYQIRVGTGETEEAAIEASKKYACKFNPYPDEPPMGELDYNIVDKDCTESTDEPGMIGCTVTYQCR